MKRQLLVPQKTPLTQVIGVFFCLIFSLACGADCPLPASLPSEPAIVTSVIDGDTVELDDGRRVRLIGVNAPEMNFRKGSPELFAFDARQAVREWVDARSGAVLIAPGQEPVDRYGRQLAHLFSVAGESLEAALVARGLALAVAIPPNTGGIVACLFERERQARSAGAGGWQRWQPQVLNSDQQTAGFRLVKGRVARVSEVKGHVWIELDGALVLHIKPQNRQNFPENLTDWQGREFVVRGWVVPRKLTNSMKNKGFKPLVMEVGSPLAMKY